MALVKFIVRIVVVVALAVLAGGCASKKANWEIPSQPEPASTTKVDEAEKARREKVSKEAERDEKKDGLEQEIRDTRETRNQRRERQAKAKESELERLVYVPTQEEREILARAAEIEAKQATAAAQKAKEVGDSPAMRQARRERARVDKNSRQDVKFNFESKRDTGLRCQSQQDYDNVVIHPGSAKRYSVRSHSTMFIRNTLGIPVDIMFASGSEDPVAVEQLCPGGSISIQKALDTFLVGDMMMVSYTASVPGKELLYPTSPAVMVMACRYNGCQKEFAATWEIRLR